MQISCYYQVAESASETTLADHLRRHDIPSIFYSHSQAAQDTVETVVLFGSPIFSFTFVLVWSILFIHEWFM